MGFINGGNMKTKQKVDFLKRAEKLVTRIKYDVAQIAKHADWLNSYINEVKKDLKE